MSGCGKQDRCAGQKASTDSAAPRIVSFDYQGTDARDPWLLIYKVHFSDTDADLNKGYAFVYVNKDTDPAEYLLTAAMAQSGILDETQSGDFALPIRLQETAISKVGLDLSIQLRDENNHLSNCYTLTQSITTKPND